MKLVGIILAGTLGLSSLALTGNSLHNGHAQEVEKREQEKMYLCPMMEIESMKEMRDICMQYHKGHISREETNNQKHQMYGCYMQ